MNLPIATLDRKYGFGNIATLADAVLARLIGLGHLDESNTRLLAAYQERALTRLRVNANAFYTDAYHAVEIEDKLSDMEPDDFVGSFELLDERVDALFAP